MTMSEDARNTDATEGAFERLLRRVVDVRPGETRAIPLSLRRERDEGPVAIAFPITIRGKLEWGDNQATAFEQSFTR